jgi:hypothetical protein
MTETNSMGRPTTNRTAINATAISEGVAIGGRLETIVLLILPVLVFLNAT